MFSSLLYFTIKEQSSITKYANFASKREKVSKRERMAKLRSEKKWKKWITKERTKAISTSHKAFFFGDYFFRIVNNAQFLYIPFFVGTSKKQDFFSRIFFLILFSFLLFPFFLEYEMRAIFRVWWKDYFRYLKTALTHFHSCSPMSTKCD